MKRNPKRWRAVTARLSRELTVWMATVKSDGRPHLVPVYFVWLDEKIYLVTSSYSQKYTNLRNNQNISLSLNDPYNVLIIEGEAHAVNRATTDSLAEHFIGKYDWDFRTDRSDDWKVIEVTPHKFLAWGDGFDSEGIRV